MFKKTGLPKLSSKHIKPLPLEFAELDENIEDLTKTIQTPPHQSYMIKQLQGIKTQKLTIAKRAIVNGEHLPSISKYTDHLKENLFDLDLCFEPISSKNSQTDRFTDRLERNNFVIRKVNTPSKSSKGKDTSAGSSDSSLQGTNHLHFQVKNVTDSPKIKLGQGRGKSYTKNLQPCRIVHSKKLPFNLNPQTHKKRRSTMDNFELDISIIEKKQEDDTLISMDSYQNLCSFF